MSGASALREVWRFLRQPAQRRELTFYSEGPGDWPHLSPILLALLNDHTQPMSYVASRDSDPGLQLASPLVSTFRIGDGAARTILFRALDARVVVMTMPDLDAFHIRRSSYPVEYVYVFHAINSTHMIYRANAFDRYDTIFCVGPHHVQEIRERERQQSLGAKRLVEHGSGRLDALMTAAAAGRTPATEPPMILVAPTWGEESLVESCGIPLIASLLAAGNRVSVRPHPMQWERSAMLGPLVATFASEPRFAVDRAAHADSAYHEAALMVSDWSGAGLEFALGLSKPVLWMDVPRKVRNPQYETLGLEPIEVTLRSVLGKTLAPAEAGRAGAVVGEMLRDSAPADFDALRARVVFNPGRSGAAGAEAVMQRLRAYPKT